ncbi:Nup210l [Symbiodinium natans]|uniref:Nup210l protein n=1 Tax=Symbiodinium natans TaxID=878477 RepID=A0A812JED9_9DINO|nr:Nup210l [Symbiodinium natans]
MRRQKLPARRHAFMQGVSSWYKMIQAQPLGMAEAWHVMSILRSHVVVHLFGQPVAIIRSVADRVDNVEKILVLAQDIHETGIELRCEVYIANIHRIEVETSVRRINVDDVETLGVKAYDRQGNVFSSLEGLAFRWHIGDAAVLQRPKLVDSAFKLSPVRRALVEAGADPDMVLLRGVATGRTTVGANLTVVGLKHAVNVISPDVPLTVLENIVVLPSLLRAPPMAHLQLELKILRGPRRPLEEFPSVPLPVPHFSWQTQAVEGMSDPASSVPGLEVLYVQPQLGRVVTQRIGSGRVLAVDSRIENNSAASIVHVSDPASLRFSTEPLWRGPGRPIEGRVSGWLGTLEGGWEDAELQVARSDAAGVSSAEPQLHLVQGRTYALKLELLDNHSRPMQIPLNLRAHARCVEAEGAPLLQLLHQASNSAVIIFRAVELGEGSIVIEELTLQADSEDQARGLKTLALKLRAKQGFHVAPELRPLVPISGPMLLPRWHSYLLQVSGGSGQQAFTLTQLHPTGVASVSPEGRVQAFGQLGNAELRVSDMRNPDNNFTLPVLVRRAGHLRLLPRYLQIRLPPGPPVEEVVRVQARPEEGDDADLCKLLRNLSFWNCSALFPTDQLVPEVSNKTVASVLATSSGDFATCAVLRLRPRAPGRFQLVASAQEADAPRSLTSTSLPFEVYKPLEWRLLRLSGLASPAEVLAAAESNETAPLVVAPCSSISLRIAEGPLGLTVPGRETWNLTAGPHISVQRLTPRSFQVTCTQVMPGPVRLIGEVWHAPVDSAHGEIFVDRVMLWLRCSVPARVQATAELDDVDILSVADAQKDRGNVLGVQRGRDTAFRARFTDAFGRTILNASEYWLRWSLLPTGKDVLSVPFQKAWLSASKEDLSMASLVVPGDATVGATARLKLEVSLPPSSLCASAATLAALPLPSDDLGVVVARKLELRWPGHPEKPRFAMFKNLSIVLEAGFGTGRAHLEVPEEMFEVVEASEICGHADVQPCIPALWIGSPCNVTKAAVQRWFLKPLAQGSAFVRLWDPDLLGAQPQQLEITVRAAKQLELGLLGQDAQAEVTVVRGVLWQLRVDIRDAEGEALGMVNWAALELKLRSSDPGAFEVRESTTRCGQHECICHTPGIYRLSAEMQDFPSGTIYSRVLHVHCLPEFDVVLKDIVVMPGQAFELTFTGGPPRSDERTTFRFTSSDSAVASIDEGDGLVIARSPGSAELSVQLLERNTRREIARAGAYVTVGVPWNASIGAVDSLSGHREGEGDEGILRLGTLEPLRLRARLWSGALELTPVLLAMASSEAAPSFSAEISRTVYRAAQEMRKPVVEAVEAASAAAQRLAMEEGLTGRDSAGAGAALGLRCHFRWTSDSSVVLEPVGFGALAVDVRIPPAVPSTAGQQEVDVMVQITCPLGSGDEQLHLQAKRLLPVVQPLALLAPSTGLWAVVDNVDTASLLVPPHARLFLHFNLPRSQLKVDVGQDRIIQLLETGEVVELETGSEEGQSALRVQAVDSQLRMPPMQVSVFVRKVFAARLDAVPSRLPLGATALCPFFLVDAAGQTMTLPSNFQVEVLSSHPVLMAEVHRSSRGTSIYLRPLSEGCTLLSAAARVPDGRQLPSDVAELCVVRGALVGQGPLLLQPGARLNLDAEELRAAGGAAGRAPLAFSLRIAEIDASRPLEEAAGQLAEQVATALAAGLPEAFGASRTPETEYRNIETLKKTLQVRMLRARWSVKQEAGETLLGAEVDLEVSARDLAKAAGRSAELGLRDLAEVLWASQEDAPYNTSLRMLRLLDFGWGVRATGAEVPAASTRCGGCCVKLNCRSCCEASTVCGLQSAEAIAGWHSLQPHVVQVEGPRVAGLAREPGVATLRYCDGIVTADIQVTVAHAGRLVVHSAPEGGPSPILAARKIFSNEANSEPIQVKFLAFQDGPSQLENQFLSGPFLVQNFRLQCEPTQAAMLEFFTFQALGDACVLTAREPSATALQRLAPTRLGLAASLPGNVGGGAVLEWVFTPQFRILQAGQIVEDGEVCSTLSTSSPQSTVTIWTGGHAIQADLAPIRNPRRGNISIQVRQSYQEPLVALHLFWHGAVEWGSVEEVQLTVWCPATTQANNFRVRIEPTKKVECLQADDRSTFELCLLILAIAAILWLLARSCFRPSPAEGHGAFQSVSAGPVFSGDPWAGPRAVSPFQALG